MSTTATCSTTTSCRRSAPLPLASITGDDVRDWYQRLDPDTPTLRAHCYGLLRTILGTAAANGKIAANPATITGAGSVKRVHTRARPASTSQAIAWEMPRRYRAMVMLAAWCALEVRGADRAAPPRRAALGTRRRPRGGGAHRARCRAHRGRVQSTTPKSDAGIRDVSVPPHIVPVLRGHQSSSSTTPLGAAVPGRPRRSTWHRPPSTGTSTRPATGWAAPTTLARPAAHRRRPRGGHRRHPGRPDGPPRSLDPGRRDALPARLAGLRRRAGCQLSKLAGQ